mmetsp:Transcript_3924/g.11071  ORF Transcript_3924/g.11071 Transcript_3924/m.11071 type:complete len:227 (+) Transcript_3924:323-1003(+)
MSPTLPTTGLAHASTRFRAIVRLSLVSCLLLAIFITMRPIPDLFKCSGCAGNSLMASSNAVRIASIGWTPLFGVSHSLTRSNASYSNNVCLRARCLNKRPTNGSSFTFAVAGSPRFNASLSSFRASPMRCKSDWTILSLSSAPSSFRFFRFMRSSVGFIGLFSSSARLGFFFSSASKSSPAPGLSPAKFCFSFAYSARIALFSSVSSVLSMKARSASSMTPSSSSS